MEFYIINDVDRADERHVVQTIDSAGNTEYMNDNLSCWHKSNNRLLCREATTISEFGFGYNIIGDLITFYKTCHSKATYKDGRPRKWQGKTRFTLRLKTNTEK